MKHLASFLLVLCMYFGEIHLSSSSGKQAGPFIYFLFLTGATFNRRLVEFSFCSSVIIPLSSLFVCAVLV